jgi:Uncharacterized conserved protein
MEAVIQAARELGKQIQADETFIRFMTAQEASESDTDLQEKIQIFNQKRNELNGYLRQGQRDDAQVVALETEVQALYAGIFENPNMVAFNATRGEVQKMLDFVNQIIAASTNGNDPDKVEYQEDCGGSCSSCAGC